VIMWMTLRPNAITHTQEYTVLPGVVRHTFIIFGLFTTPNLYPRHKILATPLHAGYLSRFNGQTDSRDCCRPLGCTHPHMDQLTSADLSLERIDQQLQLRRSVASCHAALQVLNNACSTHSLIQLINVKKTSLSTTYNGELTYRKQQK